jgi:hypothetical protein
MPMRNGMGMNGMQMQNGYSNSNMQGMQPMQPMQPMNMNPNMYNRNIQGMQPMPMRPGGIQNIHGGVQPMNKPQGMQVMQGVRNQQQLSHNTGMQPMQNGYSNMQPMQHGGMPQQPQQMSQIPQQSSKPLGDWEMKRKTFSLEKLDGLTSTQDKCQ